jgi:exodeoxyribonuclease V gamma subunit
MSPETSGTSARRDGRDPACGAVTRQTHPLRRDPLDAIRLSRPLLHIHPASRADTLVHALGDLLVTPAADPFAREVVGVPTRGVERWLTQTLATRLGSTTTDRRDGIVANVAFPSPREIVDDAIAAATGIDRDADPWSRARMTWALLATVDAHLGEEWLAILRDHLRDSAGIAADDALPEHEAPRRLVAVRHLAGLYDRYALHRPAMLHAWARGEDVDGSGATLHPEAAWQAELWRQLRTRIDAPDPAERLDAAVATICDTSTPLDLELPPRLSLFGLTRLPPAHLAILRALAARHEVHLFLLHPSPALWEAVAARLATADHEAAATAQARREDDPTAGLARNRILASWGRDARELQVVLGAGKARVVHAHPGDGSADVPAGTLVPPDDGAAEVPAGTLLQRLQADVRADVAPPGPPRGATGDATTPDQRPLLDPTDRSVELHACHGRARQVEVLRDAILHALREDPTLEPRDVIVMCPDIETFAPLIHATFGAAGAEPTDDPDAPPDLRVRLADRALRQTNPVLGVVGRLLDLATERMTASQVLDLVDRAPVRRRFGLDDDDLARLEDWIAGTGTRWGLDAPHRAPFRLDGLVENTWRTGLDRVLVGVTMTEDGQRLVAGVLPLDDVESGAIDLAGRIAELIDRLDETVTRFQEPRTIADWATELATAADLLTATGPRDEWQRAALDRLLADLAQDAGATAEPRASVRPASVDLPPENGGASTLTAAGRDGGAAGAVAVSTDAADPLLDVGEVRALLDDALAGRSTRANFRTGHLTVCTLQPMRSIPHRVVCLLGLDDDCFPRKSPRDGDDLITADPHVGDHDGRGEDRQMLLDALLAAGDRLVITTTGNDERTNTPCPPAVPVGELLDAIDRTVRTADGTPARAQITVRHPLQPFDPRNFTPGRLTPDQPFGFDPVTLAGARALAQDRHAKPRFLSQPLDPLTDTVVELDDLVRFVEHPARAFLRRRLGVSLSERDDEVHDGLPIDLDHLEQWAIGNRMLQARLAGRTLEETIAAERARGVLPPGAMSTKVVTDLGRNVESVAAAAQQLLDLDAGERTSLDVRVTLPDGRLLSGTVPGVRGTELQLVLYSRLGPKHRLAAWVRFLALTATHPDRAITAATLGRARFGAGREATVSSARIDPLESPEGTTPADHARALLGDLVDLMDRGLSAPAPLVCATSAAYAQAVHRGFQPMRPASSAWTSTYNFDREDKDPEHRLLYGRVHPFENLVRTAPRADEQGDGWDAQQPSRFGRWALRLWTPLLDAETVVDR